MGIKRSDMAVAFNTKMMLAACVLIALVAAIDEAGVAAIDGRGGKGNFNKPDDKPFKLAGGAPPTKNPTRAPTEKVCCEYEVDQPAKCISSPLPSCLQCPSGSNVS